MLKNKKGFTIIEIMVVIALIAILAVVLVPKFTGVKDRAKDTGVMANVKVVQAYAASVVDDSSVNSATTTIDSAITGHFTTNKLVNPYDNNNVKVDTDEDKLSGGDILITTTGSGAGDYKVKIEGYNKDKSSVVATVYAEQ